MEDTRVSLAKEAGADEEVVAILLAGVVLRFGFGGSPELAQPIAAVILLSLSELLRACLLENEMCMYVHVNFTYMQTSRLTRQAW
jgi:hypothetical protein